MTCIYIAISPSDKIYVGKTINFIDRWQRHKRLARSGSPFPFHRAIRKYGASNFEIVKISCTESELDGYERFLIALFRAIGKTYNVLAGGEGMTSLSWKDPELRAKRLASMRSPKQRARLSELSKKRWANPESRAKLISGLRKSQSAERRAKNSVSMKKRWEDPNHREKVIGGQTLEFVENQRARGKSRWQDPEYRKERSATAISQWKDPKYRANMTACRLGVKRKPYKKLGFNKQAVAVLCGT